MSDLSSLSPCPTLLATISRSDIAISAVQSVSTDGVFDTVMPNSFAASISIWLKPTPKLAIILAVLPSTLNTSRVTLSVTVGMNTSQFLRASLS